MSDHLPTVCQIDSARTPLETAAAIGIAVFYMDGHAPEARVDLFRRMYVNNLQQAARALGLELVHRSGPVLAIDNSNMREVK